MNLHITPRWIALFVLIVGLAACTAPIPSSPPPATSASAHQPESPTIIVTDDKALQLRPDNALAYDNRGNFYMKEKQK